MALEEVTGGLLCPHANKKCQKSGCFEWVSPRFTNFHPNLQSHSSKMSVQKHHKQQSSQKNAHSVAAQSN